MTGADARERDGCRGTRFLVAVMDRGPAREAGSPGRGVGGVSVVCCHFGDI